jgi:ABC-2 type transport system permease protein
MLKYLIEKEFKQIRRNPILPKLIFVFPVIMMLLIPNAADMEVKNLRVCVLDNDHSAFSNRLISKVHNSNNLDVSKYVFSHVSAIKTIEEDNADLILEIPENFEKEIVNTGNSTVMVEANAVNATKGGIGSSYLLSVVNDFSKDLISEGLSSVKISETMKSIPKLEIIPKSRFNPQMKYKVFMVPALMVMLITMICGFFPALNIVSEKEKGTIEQINVTPVKRWIFILGKLIPYWIIGLVVLTITVFLAIIFYNIFPVGNIFSFYLFSIIYIFVVSGIGLIISNYSNTLQQAMFVMYFFLLILILMSGLFTPVQSMPLWAKSIAAVNPMKYFVEVVRAIYIKGSPLTSITKEMVILLTFGAVLNIWAVLSYKKNT